MSYRQYDRDQRRCEPAPCPCPDICEERPLRVITSTLVPSIAPGIIADTTVALSDAPEYRPDWNVCNRRRVCVSVNATLTGGTVPNAVTLILGAVYDGAPGQYYPIETTVRPVVVPAGATVNATFNACTDLDNRRYLYVAIGYVTGVTPAPGAGVVYTPPVAPLTNVTVSLFNSVDYPVVRGEQAGSSYGDYQGEGYGYDDGYDKCNKCNTCYQPEDKCGCKKKRYYKKDDYKKDYHHKKDHHKKDDCGCKKSRH